MTNNEKSESRRNIRCGQGYQIFMDSGERISMVRQCSQMIAVGKLESSVNDYGEEKSSHSIPRS